MLYILIILALLVLCLAIWALLWAIRTRQFDNLDAQAWSVVLDDDRAPPPKAGKDETVEQAGASKPADSKGTRSS